ncbi:hypothetical protein CYMTET_33615 [Cymbomonas tetramitiformis]|uniref:Uncharacterized protein n=1 Tax=Cymbomonas tetramitiformis TaxID=36881 RepID=A0AAE0FDB2_9CHLO|nr:hypothetical protein CYMTET_33615 [Cymbomonas tetramitiformis]
MLSSADNLCTKNSAPPPVHGLVLRNLGDAILAKGEEGVDEARQTYTRGIKLNVAVENAKGMPEQIKNDLLMRLGDLYGALGELERCAENFKEALRALRAAVDCFDRCGMTHARAASLNRVGFANIAKGDFKAAMQDLEEVPPILVGNEHEEEILATCIYYQGICQGSMDDLDGAKASWDRAITLAMSCGHMDLVEEINSRRAMLEPEEDAVLAEGEEAQGDVFVGG